MKGLPKTKRMMKHHSEFDGGERTKFHTPGTKPARRAKKVESEIKRKHSKEDLSKAHAHMKAHGG